MSDISDTEMSTNASDDLDEPIIQPNNNQNPVIQPNNNQNPVIQQNNNQNSDRLNANGRRNAEMLDATNGNNRQVRARLSQQGLEPLNTELRLSMMMTRTNFISVNELLSENVAAIPRNTKMDLQLLRVIANSNTGSTLGPARVYGKNNRNQSSSINYSRLFLCRVVSAEEGDVLVYLMESKNSNKNLWKRFPGYRDDGTITIGTMIRILSPEPIKNMMANQICMIETRMPAIIMKHPREMIAFPVRESIPGNESKAFVLNDCQLRICSTMPEDTRCSGLFCDKQRIHEIMERNQGCGCYSMLSRRSNLVLDHSLEIQHSVGLSTWNCFIEKFSSNKFSSLYLTGSFPSSLRAELLQMTEEYWNLCTAIDDVVEHVNQHGGWTVMGWYKKGMITDQSMVSEDNSNNRQNNRNGGTNQEETQVESGLINYHVCQLRPANSGYFSETNPLSNQLANRKYQVARLNGGDN